MREKHGRTAMVLLAAGLFLVLDRIFDPVTLAALTAVALGVYRASVRADGVGYAAMAAGTLFLMVAHWPLLVLLAVAASAFFMRAPATGAGRRQGRGSAVWCAA